MKFEIIPKQDIIPVFDSKGIKIKYIRYDPLFDNEEYEEEDITETPYFMDTGTDTRWNRSIIIHGFLW